MARRARAAADDDGVVHEGRGRGAVQDGPVVGLLAAHAEAEHGSQRGEAEVRREEGMVGFDGIFVAERVVGWEEGVARGGAGLAVSQAGGDDYVVGG